MLHFITLEMREIFRNSKLSLLLSIISIISMFLAITLTVDNYLDYRRIEENFINAYGNENTLTYRIDWQGGREVHERLFTSEETAIQRMNIFQELMENPHFQFHFSRYDFIQFPSDKFSGAYLEDMLEFKDQDFLFFHAIFADNLFMSQPGVSINSGTGFSETDFLVENRDENEVPLILGSGFKEFYQIGDSLTDAFIDVNTPVDLKIIGFLESDSHLFIKQGILVPLDYVMIVPSRQVNYHPIMEDGSLDSLFLELERNRQLTDGLLVFPSENQDIALSSIETIFNSNDFYEVELISETEEFLITLQSVRSQSRQQLLVTIAVMILFLSMMAIQAYYRIIRYQKKFSTLVLNGMGKKKLNFLINADAFIIIILGSFLFIILNEYLSAIHFTYGMTAETTLAITTFLCLLMSIRIWLTTHLVYKLNISCTLRQRE